jgi:hypothetical protein
MGDTTNFTYSDGGDRSGYARWDEKYEQHEYSWRRGMNPGINIPGMGGGIGGGMDMGGMPGGMAGGMGGNMRMPSGMGMGSLNMRGMQQRRLSLNPTAGI